MWKIVECYRMERVINEKVLLGAKGTAKYEGSPRIDTPPAPHNYKCGDFHLYSSTGEV